MSNIILDNSARLITPTFGDSSTDINYFISAIGLRNDEWEATWYNSYDEAVQASLEAAITKELYAKSGIDPIISVHSLATQSAYIIADKMAALYGLEITSLDSAMNVIYRGRLVTPIPRTPHVLFYPYVDNIFGYNHLRRFAAWVDNVSKIGMKYQKGTLILDATFANHLIFDSLTLIQRNNNNMSPASIILIKDTYTSEEGCIMLYRKKVFPELTSSEEITQSLNSHIDKMFIDNTPHKKEIAISLVSSLKQYIHAHIPTIKTVDAVSLHNRYNIMEDIVSVMIVSNDDDYDIKTLYTELLNKGFQTSVSIDNVRESVIKEMGHEYMQIWFDETHTKKDLFKLISIIEMHVSDFISAKPNVWNTSLEIL